MNEGQLREMGQVNYDAVACYLDERMIAAARQDWATGYAKPRRSDPVYLAEWNALAKEHAKHWTGDESEPYYIEAQEADSLENAPGYAERNGG